MDSLQLPTDPDELLTECTTELDAMWRHMAARAADGDLTVDADGRVHAAALKAIPEPATLVELRRRCQAQSPYSGRDVQPGESGWLGADDRGPGRTPPRTTS